MKLKFSEKVILTIVTSDIKKLKSITVQKLADEFGYNRCYLSIKFKKETQMLVSEFLNNEKLNRAENIIKSGDNIPIYEISKKVGFKKISSVISL
ncbi:MAG: helix-turn-helix transcriptional regulator [Candidatus Aminicenantes bacterium]|nr:helix-turn-helix transcriptional regulator [Candidatus Aminicenantes bacterium]